MIYLNVDADQKPEKVMMENLPGGAMTVRMADNIKEYRQEDAKDRKMYRFDEVVFELPADSTITTKQIEDDFEKYWEYGKTDQAGKDEDMKDDEPDPESGGMTRAEMTVEIQKLQEKNEMLECRSLYMLNFVRHSIYKILFGKEGETMMAMLWAQKIMYAETKEEAIALYKRVPRLLKDKVEQILIESGCEDLIKESEEQ